VDIFTKPPLKVLFDKYKKMIDMTARTFKLLGINLNEKKKVVFNFVNFSNVVEIEWPNTKNEGHIIRGRVGHG